MPLKGLKCQVSKLTNSDMCPRPTTKDYTAGQAGPQFPGFFECSSTVRPL
jgi:hypothetical protein